MTKTAVVDASWRRAAVEMFEWVAKGRSLQAYCDAHKMSASRLWHKIEDDKELKAEYARVKELRADIVFDALDELCEQAVGAEDAVKVAGLRLKADTLKWKLARMNSKKYGDKVVQEHTGPDGGPVQLAAVNLRGLSEAELEQLQKLTSKAHG